MKLVKIAGILAILSLTLSGPAVAATVSGTIYHDGNLSALTYYQQELDAVDRGLRDIVVHLLGAETEDTTQSAAGGTFSFADLTPGAYFLDVEMDTYECTSNNVAYRVPEAIREGYLNIVCFGDSIGILGSEHPYPERLGWLFEPLTDVEVNNVHVSGSRSWEWLPGAEEHYWEDLALPLLPDADLVTFTITGNDLDAYVEGMSPPYDPWQIVQNFLAHPEYLLEAIPRLVQIVENVHTENPTADVVFILYPNFGNSTYLVEALGSDLLQPLAASLMAFGINLEAKKAGGVSDTILTDMIGYYGDTWMDPYLVDIVHPSDAGSQDYAEQTFLAMGGVIIEEETPKDLGVDRMFGFDAPDLADDDDDDNDDNDDNDDDDNDDDASPDDDDDDTADDDDTTDDDDIVDDDTSPNSDDDDSSDDDDAASEDDDDSSSDDDDDSCGC